jgi:acetylornithine deacetylase/succinyl-diaminopimelate desuccinylase-like protein
MTWDIDWDSATGETVQHLTRLIRAETVNPPGNELPAILEIKQFLESEGLGPQDFTIVESAPNRVNLVARLCGDGSQRPLLLSGHVDVVPVERERWTHDPFGGEVIDGQVWGRGALDMKGFLAMYLQVFLQARRLGLPLKRDLILAAIADEEAGFTHGSKFLVDRHRLLIDAEYGLTEGGAMTVYAGRAHGRAHGQTRIYPIQAAEKGICWLRMTAAGQPGHGSLPHDDNAVFHLARALDRLRRARHLPVHITPTYRSMLQAAASQVKSPLGRLVSLLGVPWAVSLLLWAAKGRARSMLTAFTSNTCSPTVLQAGTKTNVIPSQAAVHLDCRKLPGQSPQDVMREIRAVTGDRVTLEVLDSSPGAEFSTETPLYRLLETATRRMDPGGIVIPMLMPGATDACQYQRAGIQVYGFTPGVLPPDYPVLSLGHGHDERLPISFIRSGLPALWQVVTEFCA